MALRLFLIFVAPMFAMGVSSILSAGIVSAVQVGGDLMIVGTNSQDILLIRPWRDGGIQVYGFGNTYVNDGGNRAVAFYDVVGDVYVELGNGNDRVKVSGFHPAVPVSGLSVLGNLEVNAGPGHDVVVIRDVDVLGDLSIRGEAGGDFISCYALVDVQGNARLEGGDGRDYLEMYNSKVVDRLRMIGGQGIDQMVLHRSRLINLRGLIRGESGNDRVLIQHQDNKVIVDGNEGFDRVDLNSTFRSVVLMRNVEDPEANFDFDHHLRLAYQWLVRR